MVTLSEALERYPGAVSFTFGDNAALNAEVLELVRAGRKTVTCDAWSLYGDGGEPLPEPGRVDIGLAWSGAPAVAVRTLKVEKRRFCDVTEDMIPPMGEFRDLAAWRKKYGAYLTRTGLFHDEIEMMIETFELVRDFGADP